MASLVGPTVALIAIAAALCAVVVAMRDDPVLRRRWTLLDLMAHSPGGFEQFVERVLLTMGYRSKRGTKQGADGGVDLVMLGPVGETVLVQCKNWLKWTVGVETVRAMYGVLAQRGADRAIVVTSGTFSRTARSFARSTPRERPIELIDGRDLVRLSTRARSHRLGKRRESSQRILSVLESIDRMLPMGRLVDWLDFQFQHRPLWVPVAIAVVGGVVLEMSLHIAVVAGEWTFVLLLAGTSAHAWRWWQGKRLSQIRSVADLRTDTMTRGRLEYLVMEACQRQGFKVREFKPQGKELWSLEVLDGNKRTLVHVLPPQQARLDVDDVRTVLHMAQTHHVEEAALVITGVASAAALRLGEESGIEILGGRALAAFLMTMGRRAGKIEKAAASTLPSIGSR